MTRPNVLLIVFDCLGESDLAQYADELPNLTLLRRDSLSFANAYAPSPESGPARASLFTGLDMAAHGVWTDGVALPDHEITLPERFAGAGFYTWLVGRRQLAGVSNWTTEHARAHEYTHFDWAHGPLHRSRQNAYLAWLEEAAADQYASVFPRQANADDTVIPVEQRAAMAALPDRLSFNHWAGQQTLRRITEVPKDQRYFGIIGFVTGDTMGVSPVPEPCFETVSERALAQADMAIGAIVEAAKNDPNLILAVTAARGSVRDRESVLERDALNVPLILQGKTFKSTQINEITSTIDLAPTLYELAGVSPPPRIQGRSLLSQEPRGWALARFRHPDAPAQTALLEAQWKLIFTHGDGLQRLYDLGADPKEESNLANDPAHQSTLDNMLDMMIDARVALEDRTEPRIALF